MSRTEDGGKVVAYTGSKVEIPDIQELRETIARRRADRHEAEIHDQVQLASAVALGLLVGEMARGRSHAFVMVVSPDDLRDGELIPDRLASRVVSDLLQEHGFDISVAQVTNKRKLPGEPDTQSVLVAHMCSEGECNFESERNELLSPPGYYFND